MDNPLQNSLACIKCGRIFPKGQFGPHTMCPVCPDQELKPWMESPSWTFLLSGALGLPIVGWVFAAIAKALGGSLAIRYAAFAFVPALIAIANVLTFVGGHRAGNYMVKRGGRQGLLMILGFVLALALVVAISQHSALGLGLLR